MDSSTGFRMCSTPKDRDSGFSYQRGQQFKPGDTLLADISGEALLLRQEPKSNAQMNHVLEAAFNCWHELDVFGTDYVRALRAADRLISGNSDGSGDAGAVYVETGV